MLRPLSIELLLVQKIQGAWGCFEEGNKAKVFVEGWESPDHLTTTEFCSMELITWLVYVIRICGAKPNHRAWTADDSNCWELCTEKCHWNVKQGDTDNLSKLF